MADNEELTKTVKALSESVKSIKDDLTESVKSIKDDLTESVKSIKDELVMLKRGAKNNGSDPLPATQQSSAILVAGDNGPPPSKKSRMEEDEADSDELEELEEDEETQTSLVSLSAEATAFLEVAFGTKLENKTRVSKAKGQGTPDSRWIRCAKIDPVVATNVPTTARTADRAASRLQQFWLDAVNPLVLILERAEEFDLPKEVIGGIQTALQLMGNANYHHSTARRQALMLRTA